MYRTAWSKQNSSLTSDRIKPVTKTSNNVAKSKGKGKQQQPVEPPKSKEVQRLETLLEGVQKSTGQDRDPKGGCFCLARIHELSPYIPICPFCGLILCSVNLPQYSCPHCANNLMAGTVCESLISQLDTQLASTIAKEIADKERALEEAQRAAGAFPQLLGSPSQSLARPQATIPPPSRQTHKVMSLTSSKRVLVSSYTTTPVSSRPVSRNEEAEEKEPRRIPPPPSEPTHADRRPSSHRLWENLIQVAVTYQQPSR
ncbi:hypothetical protein BDZ97DRAFT_1588318, partial [Flammula alnicola]